MDGNFLIHSCPVLGWRLGWATRRSRRRGAFLFCTISQFLFHLFVFPGFFRLKSYFSPSLTSFFPLVMKAASFALFVVVGTLLASAAEFSIHPEGCLRVDGKDRTFVKSPLPHEYILSDDLPEEFSWTNVSSTLNSNCISP
jgi:hypothetical protein